MVVRPPALSPGDGSLFICMRLRAVQSFYQAITYRNFLPTTALSA
jgi:hypothetical protein